ncbi:MAG: hypothetical protein ACYS0G_07875 [Planctomycetota bacterium]|jgi:hypothetical protein
MRSSNRVGARRRLCACTGLFGLVAATTAASAEIITPGDYRLHNHPDGGAAPPEYGLRLDELIGLTPDHDVFTFDFDAPGALMVLRYDGTSIRISGTAFGGLVDEDEYDPDHSGFAQIDFTYTTAELAEGDDDLVVVTPDFSNTGTITFLGEKINLFDRADDDGFTFRLGDEDDNEGHRGFEGISGWGWLDHHEAGQHVVSSDWIFTAELIPAPPVLAAACAGLLVWGRRRSRSPRA